MIGKSMFGCEYEFFTGLMESSHSLRNLPLGFSDPRHGDFTYTYGPEVSGFISGADYSMDLHELFVGYIQRF